jgi:hypothetical protein
LLEVTDAIGQPFCRRDVFVGHDLSITQGATLASCGSENRRFSEVVVL